MIKKTTKIILIAGAAVAAILLLGKKSPLEDSTSGGYQTTGTNTQPPATMTPTTPFQITPTTPKTSIPQSSGGGTKGLPTPTKSQLTQIEANAKANTAQTLYYPEFGIVTTGGLGYSTMNPSSYAVKTIPKTTTPTNSFFGTRDLNIWRM